MTTLRVALIGCGIISEAHIHAYAQHADRARITVCCDIDPTRAAQRAAEVEGARAVTSLEAVLNDPEVDAIELCTPHHLHRDAVLAAARAGKHILCQKPLSKTLDDCDVMIAAAREAGVVLFYGETNHCLPATVEARRAVDAGRIGRLVGIQATFAYWQGGEYLSTSWRYNPAISGGGQLLDAGIHQIAIMLAVGGPIQSVQCFTTNFRPELGGEDTAAVAVHFAGGALGTLFSSQAIGLWSPGPSVSIYGTEGILMLGGPHGALTLYRRDLPDHREVLLERNNNPFVVMIGHYLDAVLNGAPNRAPGSVGRDSLQVVLAAYRSAELGRVVDLSEVTGAVDG